MPLRPTPDAMRERAFAVLGGHVAGAAVLDLFAGTGAIGLEALSRGARRSVFVDRHRAAAGLIRANATSLGLDAERDRDRWLVITRPARAAVAELARRRECFELVWADPPFEQWRLGLEAVVRARECGLLTESAIVCLECPAEARLDPADLEQLAGSGLEPRRDLSGGASRVLMLHTLTDR
jgi:16S rRNA (guanine(966)-N(2))-methyltransferase RsmD